MTPARILAFGAAGPIAGLVPPVLQGRSAAVRAFVHDPAQADAVRSAGADEVALGDMAAADSVAAALTGIDAVFYIAPVDLPDQAAIGRRIVQQAEAAGVRRFVFSSVIHPVLDLPNHAGKVPVEAAVISSGMEYVILHPAILYQNFAAAWASIRDNGVLAEPWSNETKHVRVDYRDVAEVVAMSLFEDRLVDGTFELCAPGLLDRHEVAAIAAEVLGRPVEAKQLDPASLGADSPIRPMAEHYDRHGLRGNAIVLEAILGRTPRMLRTFFEDLPAGRT